MRSATCSATRATTLAGRRTIRLPRHRSRRMSVRSCSPRLWAGYCASDAGGRNPAERSSPQGPGFVRHGGQARSVTEARTNEMRAVGTSRLERRLRFRRQLFDESVERVKAEIGVLALA